MDLEFYGDVKMNDKWLQSMQALGCLSIVSLLRVVSLPFSPSSDDLLQGLRLETVIKLHSVRIGIPHDTLHQHDWLGISSSETREPGTDQHGCSSSTASTVIGPAKSTGSCGKKNRGINIDLSFSISFLAINYKHNL